MTEARSLNDLRRGATGTAVAEARKPHTLLDLLDNPRTKNGLQHVAGKTMSADRILQLATTAVKTTPQLLQCNPKSVLGAIMASTALRLEFNTKLQHAFLIPYKKRANVNGRWIDTFDCQFQVGYRGFVVLAYRSPSVKDLRFNAVRRGDRFEHMEGSETFLRFSKNMEGDRGELIGAFSHAHMANGGESAVVLTRADVFKIRMKSETYNYLASELDKAKREGNEKEIAKAQKKFEETPWMQWEEPMWSKSALKQHTRFLPLDPGDALAAGALLDGAGDRDADGSIIDLSAMSDPDVALAAAQGDTIPTVNEAEEPTDDQQAKAETLRRDHESDDGKKEPEEAAKPAAGKPRKSRSFE